ncbi:MAG TPA: hypothetical protein ENN41_02235, partial [Sediminispirochaeta sp.]|nr:hypothetical protein [Sediminispirochaeta sp.]
MEFIAASTDRMGGVDSTYRRVLLERNEEVSLWQHWRSRAEQEILYEVLVDRYGVPREIRFRGEDSDKVFARGTFMGRNVEEAEQEMSPQQIRDRLEEERREEVRMYMPPFYTGLEETGRRTVEVAGRELFAVELEAVPASEYISKVELLYSPDVPGGVLRLSVNGQVAIELDRWIEDGQPEFDEDKLVCLDSMEDYREQEAETSSS